MLSDSPVLCFRLDCRATLPRELVREVVRFDNPTLDSRKELEKLITCPVCRETQRVWLHTFPGTQIRFATTTSPW